MRLFGLLVPDASTRAGVTAGGLLAFALTWGAACSTNVHQADAIPETTRGPAAATGAKPNKPPPAASAPKPDAPDPDEDPDAEANSAAPEPDPAEPMPTCGDGKVQRSDGETCDPSSRDGTCVTAADCDDDNPCSEDTVRGSADLCNARCVHRPMSGVTGDGICCQDGTQSPAEDCDAAAPPPPPPPDAGTDGGSTLPGLVHRYSFDGMGPTLVDSIGTQDGRFAGGMLAGSGALDLQGRPGQYGSLPAGLLSSLRSASIEVWVTLRSREPAMRIFDFGSRSAGPPSQGTTFWALSPFSFLNGSPITVVNFTPGVDGSADQYALADTPLPTGTQRHIVCVFDADARSLQLYIDGTLAGSDTGITGSLADIDDTQLWIGRALDDSYPALNAEVQELRIYDRALDAPAIRASNAAGPDALPAPSTR